MASIRVRNLDDVVLVRLQRMAQAAGSKTLEPYLRTLLVQHSKDMMEESYAEISALRERIWEGHDPLPSDTGATLVREDRDV